jgi:hypothetical protein
LKTWRLLALGLVLAAGAGCKSPHPKPSIKAAPLVESTDKLPEDAAAGQLALAQWTEHLQEEERARQANYDRRKLPEHFAVLELLEQARDRYDRAPTKAAVARAQTQFRSTVPKLRARIQRIDRFGRSSRVLNDYAALSELFSGPYANARLAALRGDGGALEQARADAAARLAKIHDWLDVAARAEDE